MPNSHQWKCHLVLKLSQGTLQLDDIIYQIGIYRTHTHTHKTGIYRTSHPNTKGYANLSATQGTFYKILHIRTESKSQYRKIKIMSCILCNHYGIMIVSTTAKRIKGTQTHRS